jgi:hypothetical protein
MAHMYGAIPEGGRYELPPAIPNSMLYRVKQIQGVSKQILKLVPNSGQTSVGAGQKIIVSLPANSLVDLSTFEFNFTGQTQHNGNASASYNNNYVQTRFFPRNTASLIENLEIKINGQSRQNINQYGYLYNILYDYTCGDDANRKNRIGCNADPSNKAFYLKSGVRRRAGYPIGLYAVNGDNDWSCRDKDNYTIRQWLGILGGNASTTVIDTSIYGQVDIEITLAPAGVLILGAAIATATITALTTGTSEIGVATTGGSGTTGLVSSEGTSYSLSNIAFSITRYDMPSSYYDAVRSVLQSGATYKFYYPNYSCFQGIAASNKSGTTRFTLSTQSLDMVIGTFQIPNRDTQQQPMLGNITKKYVGTDAGQEFGSLDKTLNYALNSGQPVTLNNSKYFIRNGSGIKTCTWLCGNVRLAPENINEQFNGVLKAFNSQNDTLGGVYPGIQSIAHYQDQFYAHILSLNVSGEKDLYTVSGLNSSEIPISIGWEVVGGDALDNLDIGANGIFADTATTSCIPLLFACYSSHLEISAGRNVITMP